MIINRLINKCLTNKKVIWRSLPESAWENDGFWLNKGNDTGVDPESFFNANLWLREANFTKKI